MSSSWLPISTTAPILPPAPAPPSSASAATAASCLSSLATVTLSCPVNGAPVLALVKLVRGANVTEATSLEIPVRLEGSRPFGSGVMCGISGVSVTTTTGGSVSGALDLASSVVDMSASRVPFPCTRISWTPSLNVAAMAYVPPPILNVSMATAPASAPKPPEPSVADAIASRVPFPCTRISWTPSSPSAATMAYVSPLILNVTTSSAT